VFNVHRSQVRARDNPHAIHERRYQVRFSASVWSGIVVGPYLLPDRLSAQRYHHFLETVLSYRGYLQCAPRRLAEVVVWERRSSSTQSLPGSRGKTSAATADVDTYGVFERMSCGALPSAFKWMEDASNAYCNYEAPMV
jgi:hypothetical protein